MALAANSLLHNRYQILRALNQGGMGAVYVALDTSLNKRVAIKESFSNDPLANAAFHQEAQMLASLAQSNLPRVSDSFVEPTGARYLVMDFVEGETLQDIVNTRGRLTPDQMLTWFKSIFNAVNYLHTQPQPIIHRDINPRNIIIRPDGKAMLVDFGIAKVLTGAGTRTTHGLTGYGTPGYAPPEQYSGGTDQRTDVYALGATMYFVLTGQTPPDAPIRAAGTVLPPPSRFNAQISPRVESAILTAMNLNAAQRFNSVADLAQAIYAAVTQPLGAAATIPIAAMQQAAAPTPIPRTDAMVIVLGSLVGGIIFAALILGGLFASGFFGGTRATPTLISFATATPSTTATQNANPTAAPATTAIPTPVPITTIPPGITPIPPTRTDTPTFTALAPTPIDTPTDKPIPFVVNAVFVGVSPSSSSSCPTTFHFSGAITTSRAGTVRYQWIHSDGSVDAIQSLNFVDAGTQNVTADWTLGAPGSDFVGWGMLQVLAPNDIRSSQASFSIRCPIPPTLTPTFTPVPPGLPSGWIVFSSDRTGKNQIYAMDRNGGNMRQLTTNDGPNEDGAAASDQQQIVFTHLFSINNGDIFEMTIGDTPKRLTNGTINWGPSWAPDGSRIVFYSLRDGGKQIYVMNADGSNQHRISSADCAGNTDDWSPAWSRDGAWIAYESIPHKKCEGGGAADIFISDPNGGGKRNVTRSAGIDDESPNWSPDGRIVFTSTRNGNYDIFVINTDGSGLQQLTGGAEDDDYPAWSPDGSTILFQRRQNGNWEIYAMNADGSNVLNLTNNSANDTYVEWVP